MKMLFNWLIFLFVLISVSGANASDDSKTASNSEYINLGSGDVSLF